MFFYCALARKRGIRHSSQVMQFPLRGRSAAISARASRESDADIFLISCLFRVGPHCPFIRDIMTGASWVRNVGKLIERGRISGGRASERAKRARTALATIRFHSVKLFQRRIYACSSTRSLSTKLAIRLDRK